ncbi:MAG: hypothetical protein JOZ52_09400 [Acidobacteria bacterium]|nr:hypothetical protein [Acidobacteriota bacterium]
MTSNKEASAETRIIEICEMPDSALFKDLRTRRERLSALRQYFEPRKELLIKRLREIEGIRCKNLSSSNAIIVTAPADAWPSLTATGGALDVEGISIHLNKSISPAKAQRRKEETQRR